MLSSAIAAALLASIGLAAPTARAPADSTFKLTITSLNGGKYRNSDVGACHSGAAVEALCIDGFSSPFSFKPANIPPTSAGAKPGYLVYNLPSDPPLEQELYFFQNASSNVKAGFFGTGKEGPILLEFIDETMFKYESQTEATAYWYVCPQSMLGYQYETLSFVENGSTPTNPDCEEVGVKMTI